MKKEKWFKPQIHTDWDKDMPQDERRSIMLGAHKGDYLATARSLQALANATQDRETKVRAASDAAYFYNEHRENVTFKPISYRTMRLTPKFKRLPR